MLNHINIIMYRDDINNLNNAFLKVINEGVADLGPQADSQQGLSPVIPTIIKGKQEECEDCGCDGGSAAASSNPDHDEIEMARGELHNTIRHAIGLYAKLKTTNNLEAWVRAKITKAADYLNSVKHYMDADEVQSEQNEEQDLFNALDQGSTDIMHKLSSILARESKENLQKILFEVVQLIEKKT